MFHDRNRAAYVRNMRHAISGARPVAPGSEVTAGGRMTRRGVGGVTSRARLAAAVPLRDGESRVQSGHVCPVSQPPPTRTPSHTHCDIIDGGGG